MTFGSHAFIYEMGKMVMYVYLLHIWGGYHFCADTDFSLRGIRYNLLEIYIYRSAMILFSIDSEAHLHSSLWTV